MALLILGLSGLAMAADLKPKTASAFDRYVSATQARFTNEFKPGGPFLYVDGLPDKEKMGAYDELKRGGILVYKLETQSQGKAMDVPDGIVHHWVGTVFIPGVTLAQTLPVVKDYDHRAELYAPEVTVSRTIAHQGDDYKIFLRLYQKKFTTVVFNTEYDIHWRQFDGNRYSSDSISSRVAELKDSSKPDGEELPVGKDHGYLWRLNTYWRFQEKDGGVYLQCEAVSLTRDIPAGLGWLLRPLVTSVPRSSLQRVLGRTREVVIQHAKP
ncbi:MAG TPA: hypothetical protein VNW97_14250 [Candidatus Saccharimonadales bacterium]|nr:hypothetical protein [Candidatus Saccharimonadales bacterium]